MSSLFLIALGSNRRHHTFGRPKDVLLVAVEELAALGTVTDCSSIITSIPVGPAQRRFANAVLVLESEYDPSSLFVRLKHIERAFGRRDGRRWGDRVLDLDIVLWSGGTFESNTLTIPHKQFRNRDFVLAPACQIASDWRDPVTALRIRHLCVRAKRAFALSD